jgi:hypothetical protein
MPSLRSEYGDSRQWDVTMTIDQETFLKKYNSLTGFQIGEHGDIEGKLNMVAYLKMAPKELKKSVNDLKIDEDDYEDYSELEKEFMHNFTNSKDWEIARTIYMTMSLKGKVVLDKVNDQEKTAER